MASIVFAGTTIVTDSGTPTYQLIGRVQDSVTNSFTRWQLQPVIRGNGTIAKDLGTEAEEISLTYNVLITAANVDNFKQLIESKRATYGTLQFPDSESYTNCIMTGAQITRIRPELIPPSTIKYLYAVSLSFKRLVANPI